MESYPKGTGTQYFSPTQTIALSVFFSRGGQKSTQNDHGFPVSFDRKSPADLVQRNCRKLSKIKKWVFPKNGGTPKWMVYNENPIKMDDLGGTIIFGNTQINSLPFPNVSPLRQLSFVHNFPTERQTKKSTEGPPTSKLLFSKIPKN